MATPVYVTRPVVPSSVVGSASPQTYGGGYDQRITELEGKIPPPPKMTISLGTNSKGGVANFIANDRKDMGRSEAKVAQGMLYDSAAAPEEQRITETPPTPQAAGSKRGELFAYAISDPVTLQAGKAAMVPIVGGPVEGKPVTIAISDGDVGELTPSNGFRLKNTTHAHLQGGPITVYASDIYAGDALTTDLAPDEVRLISYAADLDTSIRLDDVDEDSQITKLNALAGTLCITTRDTRKRTFLIKNKSAAAKSVIIQLAHDEEYKLADPRQLLEKSADGDRFALTVHAGKTVSYEIRDQQTSTETRTIFDLTYDIIIGYTKERSISPALKARLVELQARRNALADLGNQRANLEKQLAAITEDQTRIRGNMHELNNSSALYKSYETKLGAQEPQVENLHAGVVRLRDMAAQGTKELAAYAASISAE